ncbi:MAG: hypothetical protein U9R27_07765, partial [Campylobacterota bacterium]|nr:hypothetical protein [Campylobacterota bacterium]
MYYIMNSDNQIIAADNDFLALLELNSLQELLDQIESKKVTINESDNSRTEIVTTLNTIVLTQESHSLLTLDDNLSLIEISQLEQILPSDEENFSITDPAEVSEDLTTLADEEAEDDRSTLDELEKNDEAKEIVKVETPAEISSVTAALLMNDEESGDESVEITDNIATPTEGIAEEEDAEDFTEEEKSVLNDLNKNSDTFPFLEDIKEEDSVEVSDDDTPSPAISDREEEEETTSLDVEEPLFTPEDEKEESMEVSDDDRVSLLPGTTKEDESLLDSSDKTSDTFSFLKDAESSSATDISNTTASFLLSDEDRRREEVPQENKTSFLIGSEENQNLEREESSRDREIEREERSRKREIEREERRDREERDREE